MAQKTNILKLSCPECASTDIILHGNRYDMGFRIQRYRCKNCDFRFSDPKFSRKMTNSPIDKKDPRQFSVLDKKAKKLTGAKVQEALRENGQNIKGQMVTFRFHLMKLGRSKATIDTYTKYVENIAQYGDIYDPESIKLAISTHFKENTTKRNACYAYDAFIKFLKMSWKKPDYKPDHKRVLIPTEEELHLALNCGHEESIIHVKFLYETGARANEAARLEWTDLDKKRTKVTVKASKHGNARILPISEDLIKLLFSLPNDKKIVFEKHPKNSRSSAFHNRMIRLAKIHKEPRFVKIHLHTFRYCKALREYHKTRDTLHVQWVLGHKSLLTTQRYLKYYHEVYENRQPLDYISKVATSKEERQSLIESGFEWVGQDNDGLTYFRKVKT